jgi:hypothetical protein
MPHVTYHILSIYKYEVTCTVNGSAIHVNNVLLIHSRPGWGGAHAGGRHGPMPPPPLTISSYVSAASLGLSSISRAFILVF